MAHKFKMAAGWTAPAIAGLIVLVYLADSMAIWKTFGWFVARLSFKEVLVVRGATYLLALFNYALGQGAIIYFVSRSRGVPVIRGMAAVLLIMGINVLMLLALATLGLVFVPQTNHVLSLIVAVAYTGLAVYLTLVIVKPRWLTSKPLFDVLLRKRQRDPTAALCAARGCWPRAQESGVAPTQGPGRCNPGREEDR